MAWITRARSIHAYVPSTTVQYDAPVDRTLSRLSPGARIADVGAGGRRITPETVTIDGLSGTDIDVSCDIHSIPLPDASFDCIFCTGTLEHVENPPQVLAEIHRLLRPGGTIHLEVPFLQGFHADPNDFWRWTLPGLRLTCSRAGFDHLESGAHIGPTSAMGWIAVHYLDGLLPGKLGAASSYALRFLIRPLLTLDRLWRHRPGSARIASGVYFVGLKP
jgi:SAM-dependent methyltransferase